MKQTRQLGKATESETEHETDLLQWNLKISGTVQM